MYVLIVVFLLWSGPITVRLGPPVAVYDCEVALSLLPPSPVPGFAWCAPVAPHGVMA